MRLIVGMKAEIRTDCDGSFTGEVVTVHVKGGEPTVAEIMPDSQDVRRYLGGANYPLGSAHWDQRVTILECTDGGA